MYRRTQDKLRDFYSRRYEYSVVGGKSEMSEKVLVDFLDTVLQQTAVFFSDCYPPKDQQPT